MILLVDANVLLRIFDGPEHPQYAQARDWITAGIDAGDTLRVLVPTLIEVAFVLSSPRAGYGLLRHDVAEALSAVLGDPTFSVDDAPVLQRAVDLFDQYAVDIQDAHLAATAEAVSGRILSFDTDFDRLRADGSTF